MSMIQHMLGLLCFAVIFTGPLPLCLGILFLLENKNKNKHEARFSHHMLILITSWCIIETSIGLLLGIFHLLTPGAVLLTEIIIFFTGLIFILYLKRLWPSFFPRDLLKFPEGLSSLEKLIIGVIGFIGLMLLWHLMTHPVVDYDSLAYHLPSMAEWFQTGSFSTTGKLFGQISRYPYNWEVFCTLFLIPFQEDFLVTFPNLIAWLLFGFSVYLLSAKLGVKRIHCLAATAFVMTLPIVLANVNTMHIDLPFAALFMVGLYLIITYNHTKSSYYFGLFLAVLGMIMGIKTSGIIYGLLLILIFIFTKIKSVYFDKKSRNLSYRPYKLVIPFWIWGIFSFSLLGGCWYIKNLIELGNPLGYIKIQVGNIVLFPGTLSAKALSKTTLANVFDLTDISHWKIFFGQLDSKLGIPFFVMIFFAALLFSSPFTGRKSLKTYTFIGLFALLTSTLFLYWVTPYSGTNFSRGWQMNPWFGQAIRYGFPFLGVLGIAAAAGEKKINIRDTAAAVTVLFVSVTVLFQSKWHFGIKGNKIFYIAAFLLLIWGVCSMPVTNFRNIRKVFKVSGLIVTAVLIISITFAARGIRNVNRGKAYGSILKYIEEDVDQDEIIGYIYSHRSYLFYGKNINRKVFKIPKSKDLSQFLAILRKKNIKVVAVGPLQAPQKKRKYIKRHLKWVRDPTGPFIKNFGKNLRKEPFIYRLKTAKNVKNKK